MSVKLGNGVSMGLSNINSYYFLSVLKDRSLVKISTWLGDSAYKFLHLSLKLQTFCVRNSSSLLTFLLLLAEGPSFFFTTSGEVDLTLVSRIKRMLIQFSKRRVNPGLSAPGRVPELSYLERQE